jgi:hypothetical protein
MVMPRTRTGGQTLNSNETNMDTNIGQPSPNVPAKNSNMAANTKLLRTIGIIIGAFAVTVFPLNIWYVIEAQSNFEHIFESSQFAIWKWVQLLFYLNSGVNPIIYPLTNKKFQRAYKVLFHYERLSSY